MASSSSSPCAACKFLRRKCTPECVFSPFFPPDDPQKFSIVHKVFGASNVAKLLSDLPPDDRPDAVSSLAYEAITRLNDPVYGCVGVISVLQQQLRAIQAEVVKARKELSIYMGSAALGPLPNPQAVLHNSAAAPFGIPSGMVATPQTQMLLPQQQQQAMHNQQIAVALAGYEQQALFHNLAAQVSVANSGGAAAHPGLGATPETQMLFPRLQQQSLHDQHIAAAMSNFEQQEMSNSRYSIDAGGGAGSSSVLSASDPRYNQLSIMGGTTALGLLPSSSNNPFGLQQPSESDIQLSPTAPHHQHLSLQQQQHLQLQQQQQGLQHRQQPSVAALHPRGDGDERHNQSRRPPS